eukprot:CAMPEP_0185253088 /NCGR_PEP_ID=MMETSP1359-20130426/1986_1 /TAXON_ID=552665 /ORGANISM="Bigelowiella longifila, Strain CCMP242" /LENGTH=276 /DNA_ID=CAMNT_0027835413 /DNA_START=124 /DNA_END=955 /DNA_ORIENTATION=-
MKQVLSGSIAGMSATIFVHPLDTIRTRVQTAEVSGTKYSGALDCAVKTLRYEGWKALYKGIWSPLMAQAVYKAVIFSTYNGINRALDKPFAPISSSSPKSESGRRSGIGQIMLAGAVAGGVNSFVVTPVELIRNNLMVQYDGEVFDNKRPGKSSLKFRGDVDIIRDVIRQRGIMGMWRGVLPTFLRDCVGVAAWFGFFEMTHRHVCPRVGLLDTPGLMLSGVAGGIGFWVVAFPFDTIKSMVQVDSSSAGSTVTVLRNLLLQKNGLATLIEALELQ